MFTDFSQGTLRFGALASSQGQHVQLCVQLEGRGGPKWRTRRLGHGSASIQQHSERRKSIVTSAKTVSRCLSCRGNKLLESSGLWWARSLSGKCHLLLKGKTLPGTQALFSSPQGQPDRPGCGGWVTQACLPGVMTRLLQDMLRAWSASPFHRLQRSLKDFEMEGF